MNTSGGTLTPGYVLTGAQFVYRIEKVLGQGSFGITYLATAKSKGASGDKSSFKITIKEFFMKEVNGRDGVSVTSGSGSNVFKNYRSKFVKEARSLGKIKHKNVVNVLEIFEANGTAYYSMEYLSGGSLDSYIASKGHLEETEAIRFTRTIAQALDFLHDNKILHLDLKPGNIMLKDSKEPILIDFGLAKQYDESGEPESSTSIGGGTPGYAPIEQLQYNDSHGFPVTMDIYALGGTLFKMLSGIRPPDGSTILNDGFPKEALSRLSVRPDVISFVEYLMRPLRKDRPQSAKDVIKYIDRNFPESFSPDTKTVTVKTEVSDNDDDATVITVDESDEDNDKRISLYTASNGKIYLPLTTSEIQIFYKEKSTSRKLEWFKVRVTPSRLDVCRKDRADGLATLKYYFFNEERFQKLISEINDLGLDSVHTSSQRPETGISIVAFSNGGVTVAASTFADSKIPNLLEGNTIKLGAIFSDLAMISSSAKTETTNAESKLPPIFRSMKILWYILATVLAIGAYFLINPYTNYIEETYGVGTDNSVSYLSPSYVLRFEQGGLGGIYYKPEKKWALEPTFRRSNPDQIWGITDDSFTLDGAAITNQTYKYAVIEKGDEYALYYDGNQLTPFQNTEILLYYVAGGSMIFSYYYDGDGIVSRNGKIILKPSQAKQAFAISDNIAVYVAKDDNTEHFIDLTNGNEVNSHPVITAYKYLGWINFGLVLVLVIIVNTIVYFILKRFSK